MSSTAQFWRDPNLPYVESRRACDSRANYKAHSHPTVSIGAVDRGVSVFSGGAQGPTRIQAGSVVFVPADCAHACNPLPDSAWSYQMLHLDPRWVDAVREEAQQHGPALSQVVLSHDSGLYQAFCRLNQLLFSSVGWQHKEAALIEFIGALVTREQPVIALAADPARASAGVRRVVDFLQRDPQQAGPLEHLAELAGISRYQLIRAFRAATGMTPHAYQLNQRIIQARASLQAGEASAALAQRLGFADQAHFQRVFKAHVGVTPGLYKA
ncbi:MULTISPECIES: AraC family transcriptional regulator [Pseudomonas]|uniref:helix-turn-helix domain-containing protein n=1 Tax=Pseudomonas TaxID=286 RepID=UPI0008B31E3E|nr:MULTISPECIES: AraC family transcriptional regulator [Pseudomonas]PZP10389.1 MAG: AraC family transcriptional regulator [Pseudomonas protegens]ROM13271.1 AraC family transcriptional regulator [Pseudomonas protegens]BCQ62114.1 AraC family transcriptional regulator [Pseudomonas sp. Boi14]SEP71749.1 transcriptional regulator, AraC family [Pseudomonas sp. NFPP19]